MFARTGVTPQRMGEKPNRIRTKFENKCLLEGKGTVTQLAPFSGTAVKSVGVAK